jgi:hypothetical protein
MDKEPLEVPRRMKVVVDRDGHTWLCDRGVDETRDLREQGGWRCADARLDHGDLQEIAHWPGTAGGQEDAMEPTGLRGHNLFQMLQPKEVARISGATEELAFDADSKVYGAGEPAEYFYIVREGRVALRSVSPGVNLHVDDVMPGEIFGTCLCLGRDTYALEARCAEKTKLMRIRAEVLKRTLKDDPVLGYAVQAYVSGVYFRRYIDAVTKLQKVVQSLPLQTG